MCLRLLDPRLLVYPPATDIHTTTQRQPAGVTAHHVAVGDGQRDKTVFLIKFRQDVLRREAALSS